MFPQGVTTGPMNRGLVFQKGTLQTQISNEATDGLAPSVCAFFRVQLERILAFPRQREKKTEARNHGFGFTSCSRSLVFPDGDIAAQIPTRLLTLLSNIPWTDEVVLLWQPPSYLSPWSSSSFVVGDVPYSFSEQYMMA